MATRWQQPPGGLVAEHAAEVRRIPDGTADVRAGFEPGHPRRQRRRGAAGRTAGHALDVPRVVGDAVDVVVALEVRQVERHVGLAEEHHAGGLEPLHAQCVLTRHVVLEWWIAPSAGHAGHVVGFLDGHGHAVQRPPHLALGERRIGCLRPLPRAGLVHGDDRVQLRVEAPHPLQVTVEKLGAAHFLGLNHGRELGGGLEGDVIHAGS